MKSERIKVTSTLSVYYDDQTEEYTLEAQNAIDPA